MRTRNSFLNPNLGVYKRKWCTTVWEIVFISIFLLCDRVLASSNQDTDGIVTAISHKSFYNLETLAKKLDHDMEHSRKKRSVVFTPEEIEIMLSLHQEYRRDVFPEAANMEYMTWDEDLATMAVEYSEKCIWGHGTVPNISPYSSIGQNLWIRGGTTQQPGPGPGVTAWHNEVDDYNYDSNSCKTGKQCGHYTQIVWASSRAVGCGLAYCADTENWSVDNSWILTCHYGPAGNYVGAKPYVTGQSCTQCDSEIGECYDNMCRLCSEHNEPCECRQECDNCGSVNTDTCSCECPNGWYGPKCENFCEDWHENCGKSPGWPGPQYCDAHPAIPAGCPKMCGLCVDPDPDFVCGSQEIVSEWGEWCEWSACGTPCAGSERNRRATCVNSALSDNATCPGEPPVEVQMCTDEECDTAACSTHVGIFRQVFFMICSYLVVRAAIQM
ncbi:peptidase inhibitor 15-like isoform X2 [Amphiura filiformis]|uniref:peptidase inhibitor 15-like isoform X2 n=1 Tax=Amphiura filiformis TaxID=82378 RepID=UPI003B21A34A